MSKSQKKARANKSEREEVAPDKSNKRINPALVIVILLLAFMAVQMVAIARFKSATMDEQNHITRGVTYLRTGDLRLARVHPPLINLLSALPIFPDKTIVLPLEHPSWENSKLDIFAYEFLWKANPDSHSIVFRARLPIIALTLFLGVIVYLWARELYGQTGGLLALGLLAFAPNVLAHGSLATNDLGLACFATLSLYTFWRWQQKPLWSRAVVAGIALGLAQASKYSAIFLIPAFGALSVLHWLSVPAEERSARRITKDLGWMALMGVIAAVVLWAIYGFEIGQWIPLGKVFPASNYVNELELIMDRVGKGNRTFLLGSYSNTGWWYYFPVAFLVKTPLPTLLLIGGSLVYCWRQRTWRQAMVLLVPIAIYFGFSIGSSLNIGYRHLLPAVVLLIVFAAQLGQLRWRPVSKPVWGVAIALAWLVTGTLISFPHYLAHFNEIVGGSSNGYKVMVDSNLDWGQDLIGLREYMQREGIESVKLSYFGSADPAAYGINYEPLPGFPRNLWLYDSFPPFLINPGPGIYAISATNLQGALFENHNLYAWFREREPDALIGHSIFIYRVGM